MNLPRLLWFGVVTALAAIACQYGFYAAQAIAFPFGLDYSEGLIWQQALWLGGPHLYGDIGQFPFLVCEYPPLYLVAIRLVAATGIPMLQAGRAVSVCATLGACALLGGIVWQHGRLHGSARAAAGAAIVAGLLPFTLLPVISWSVLMRVDMLALAFTYGGIFLAVLSFRRPRAIYVAIVFFVAATYTKQIYVAAPIAMLPVCLARNFRHSFRAYAVGATIGLAVLGALEWSTEGRFLRHILAYTADSVDMGKALRQVALWVGAYPVYAGLTLVAVSKKLLHPDYASLPRHAPANQKFFGSFFQKRTPSFLLFLVLYLVLTTLMLIAVGKTGSSYNYFIEWMFCWCLWLGWLTFQILSHLPARRILAVAMPALLLLQMVPVERGVRTMGTEQFSAQRRADWGALLARVRAIPGPLLSDDMVLTIEAGREVGLEPGVLLELSRMGLWDERRLTERLLAHYFGAVITAYDPGDPTFDARYLPATQAALLAAYPHVEKYGDYRLRLP